MKPTLRQARSRKPKGITSESQNTPKIMRDFNSIPGLIYIPEFISRTEHDSILNILYGAQNDLWVHEEGRFGGQLQRRNQQFGWKYDYSIQDIDKAPNPLPKWIKPYYEKLIKLGVLDNPPDQMIVNEYLPGQGITPHIDKVHCFGSVITGINLGSPIILEFSHKDDRKSSIEVFVKPRSVYLMTGACRYDYLHFIHSRTTDIVNDKVYTRKKRISLTLRNVILQDDTNNTKV